MAGGAWGGGGGGVGSPGGERGWGAGKGRGDRESLPAPGWLLAALPRRTQRTGLAAAAETRRSAAAAECGAGSASLALTVPRPPALVAVSWPRRPVSAPLQRLAEFRALPLLLQGKSPPCAVGTGPRALPVGPRQVKSRGVPSSHRRRALLSPAAPVISRRDHSRSVPADAGREV